MKAALTNATPLPANNIGQQLFNRDLPSCETGNGRQPAPCCTRDNDLQKWYRSTPTNLWNTATNYEGGSPFSACTDTAFARQCFMSQYYTYLSKNNVMPK
jgi:hypothetical protein